MKVGLVTGKFRLAVTFMLIASTASVASSAEVYAAASSLNKKSDQTQAFERFTSPAIEMSAWKTASHWYETVYLSGSALAKKQEESLQFPSGIVSEGKSVVVADTRNQVIRRLDANGRILATIGIRNTKGWKDGSDSQARFDQPIGMAADKKGNLYVADAGNHIIRKIDRNGNVSTVAGDGIPGWKDGEAGQARFYSPRAIAVAEDGAIYVADALNHVIRRIDAKGTVTTLTSRSSRIVEYSPGAVTGAGDYKDGKLAEAKFNEPSGIALMRDGKLAVADTGNQRIRVIDLKQGNVSTIAGSSSTAAYTAPNVQQVLYASGGYRDGAATGSLFNNPSGIAITEENGIVVADRWNHVVRYIYKGEVVTLSGQAGKSGDVDGITSYAKLHEPTAVAVLANGSIAVTDAFNNAIRLIRRYELPEGIMGSLGQPRASQVQLVYNRLRLDSDTAPMIKDDRTYLPLRVLSETLGYKTVWRADKRVILQLGDSSFDLRPGSSQVNVTDNGTSSVSKLPAAPFIHNGRILVPVRFVAEQFGFDVQWVAQARAVVVRDRIFLRYAATGSYLPPQRITAK